MGNDWQPPPLTARQALHEITQACADCAAVDPISAEGAPAVLARIWPVAPAVRALVALRVASYDELHQDTEAYHLDSFANVAWWSGELLDFAQRGVADQDWETVSRGAHWAKSLGEVRFAHPLRGEMGQVADAMSAFCRDAAFGASLTPAESLNVPHRAQVLGATARLSLVGGAALVRAFALDLPAAAALIGGAPRADGLRLIPGQSRSAAAITVSLDRWLRRLIILPDLRNALDRVSELADRVARTYMSHPDPGGHAYGPPDEAFDGAGMDLLEAGWPISSSWWRRPRS